MRRPSDVRGNKPDSECLLVCTTLSIRSGHIHTSSRICALRGLVFRFFFWDQALSVVDWRTGPGSVLEYRLAPVLAERWW